MPDICNPVTDETRSSTYRAPPQGALALVLTRWAEAAPGGVLHVTEREGSVGELAAMARAFAPGLDVIALPAWDSLPYDRALPSRAVTGARVAALARLAVSADGSVLVITSAAGLLQRLPPRSRLAERRVTLRPGDEAAPEWLEATLTAFGYRLEDQVDEPGEAALRGGAADVFPAGASGPVRLELSEGRVVSLHAFDPLTQRSVRPLDRLDLVPATEGFSVPGEATAGVAERLLPEGPRETLFDYLPGAALVIEPGTEQRLSDWLETITDGFEARRLAARGEAVETPALIYLTAAEIAQERSRRPVIAFAAAEVRAVSGVEPIEGEPAPALPALLALASERAKAADAVLVCAEDEPALARRLHALSPARIGSWAEAAALRPGQVATLGLPLTEGFRLGPSLSILSGQSVLPRPSARRAPLGVELLRVGDLVVEREHGLARLVALEMVEEERGATECLALEFASGQRLLVPASSAGSVWRYGAREAQAAPDRLSGEAWQRRRGEVEAEIAEMAQGIAARQAARAALRAPAVQPPRAPMERFRARMPFAPTEDQRDAIAATLAEMSGGRPMERLLCGDVGFGKTEVALHAAAAAALAGYQIAVAAPTTLLARQHVQTFRRRLGPLGVVVAPLIRSARSAEARALLARLRTEEPVVVVGTHALASPSVRFGKLGLVVIDEEQRFGERQKAALRRLREGVHALTMTATPLPRSLQAATAGLFEVSLLATPPVARQPVRTAVMAFDRATVRAALLREARRGGQSFVVCPRIEDLPGMARRLSDLAPELGVAQAHGKLPADALDAAMLDFAEGRTDVLLATGIIEAGLDIPNANTMIVWRPDRFGLAQLHQLRGRVGRGRARASAYFLTDPDHPLSANAVARLERLAALDRLGAGFAISAADLDQRGAGDLLGERQAGHVRLMGSELYGHLLGRAIAAERGEPAEPEWSPEVAAGARAVIPEAMVGEADLRIDLYRRLARLRSQAEIEAFAEELEDRFGTMPDEAATLLDLARLRVACRTLGIAALHAGPNGIALNPRAETDVPELAARLSEHAGVHWSRGRLILELAEPEPEARIARLLDVLVAP